MAEVEPAPANQQRRRRQLAPLLLALLVILILAFLVFRRFLLTLSVAAAVAVFLNPLQRRLTQALWRRAELSSGLIVLVVTLVILLPVIVAAATLSYEAAQFIEWARPNLQPVALRDLYQRHVVERLPSLRLWLDVENPELGTFVSGALRQGVSAANGLIQGAVARLGSAFLDLLVFLLSLFFMLRDGGRLRGELRRISPFSSVQEELITDHLGRTVKGVLQAMVLVPLAQGLVAYVGFLIFGMPAPLLWAVMVVLAALIPMVGSPLGWIPTCVYLYIEGATWQWVGMSLYGVFLISTIDNIIKPLLLRGSARIHPLLGFLSILGGIMSFGPLGFFVGPLILSLVLSAVRIYRSDVLGSPHSGELSVAPAQPKG
jgi:predicted PurR-regulated permease PerM